MLAIAWGWFLLYSYPGFLTQDSFDHLNEARSRIYTDAHPPVIDVLWRWVDKLIAGTFGMLLLQSLLLLFGLYIVLRRTLGPRAGAWATAALYVYPPVMLPMAVIWKDCLMASSLMVGIGALLSERRWVRHVGLAALFLATAVRYNAAAATFAPILILFEAKEGLRWFVRYPVAVAVWLAITFTAFGLNVRLTDKPMYYWHSSLAVYDIAGTLIHVDPPPTDAEVEQLLAGTELRQHEDIVGHMHAAYSTTNYVTLVGDKPTNLWNLPTGGTEPAPRAQRDAIAAAWKTTVFDHPGAYLVHRFGVFANCLGLSTRRIPGAFTAREPVWPDYTSEKLGLSTGSSSAQRALSEAAQWCVKALPIFTPWLYLVVLLALLPLARTQRLEASLLLSGLGLEASLVLLAPSSDYRYSHWMILATLTAAILLTARRMGYKRA
ncbi:MAG TPA: hypothetical protein VGM39_07660 [Kofleriaceae bacterium]